MICIAGIGIVLLPFELEVPLCDEIQDTRYFP